MNFEKHDQSAYIYVIILVYFNQKTCFHCPLQHILNYNGSTDVCKFTALLVIDVLLKPTVVNVLPVAYFKI